SFALLNPAANHFTNNTILVNDPSQFRMDNQTVLFPEGEFSTDVYTEKMVSFIKNRQEDKPFFAYLAYTAPHWPLQAPDEYIDKYKGKYDMGYDSLRVIRFNRQKAIGIIPSNARLPPRESTIKPWAQLSSEEKKIEARKMELYAAMVDNLDVHIGDVLQYLKESNKLNNTVI